MTILNQGDVAVVGWQPDTVDAFSVVFLVDVDTNDPIIFTEQSWTDGNNFASGEGQITWTPPSNLTAGTIVTFSDNGFFNGSTTVNEGVMSVYINGSSSSSVNATRVGSGENFWSTASGGDQLFVLQGSIASPSLIWGTDFDDSASEGAWANIAAGTSGTNSTRPSNSDLNTAFSPAYIEVGGSGNGNLYYSGTTTGSAAELQTAIANSANWTSQSSPFTSTPGGNPFTSLSAFTVLAPGAAPTVDTNTGSTLNEGSDDEVSSAELDTNDTDTGDSDLTYSLDTDVANGTLYLDNDNSNTFNAGDTDLGVGSTFTQANINAGNLRYAHNGGETTSDSFQFDVSDGSNPIDNQTFNFTIIPINDAPVIGNLGGDTITYFEGVNPTTMDQFANATVSDADNANFSGGTLTISFSANGQSEDALGIANTGNGAGLTAIAGNLVFSDAAQIGTFSGGTSGSALVITLNSNATPANVQTLLRNIQYTNNGGDAPTTLARTIDVVLTDGSGGTSATQQITLNITAFNDAPVASGVPTDLSFTEDTQGDVDLSAVTLTDDDSDPITLTLSVSEGTFATPADGSALSVTETLVDATTITLSGTAANINTYLDTASNIRYTGALNDNGNDTATLSLAANDGDGSGSVNLGTVNIDITAANDDPGVSGLPGDVTVAEDTQSNVDLSAASFADVDGDNITVTLTASAGIFATPADGSGVGGGVAETLVNATTITLAGAPGDINTYLDTASNIQYTPALNASGDNAATISVTANDGAGSGDVALGTVNVDITPANDAPTVSGLPSDISVTEDTPGNVDLSGATFADVDGDALTVTLTASAGVLNASSGGGVTVNGDGTGTLTLQGTVASINTYLATASAVNYTGASNVFGEDAATIAVNVDDGTVDPLLGTINVDIADAVDTQTGDNTANVLVGDAGQDILIGLGGADALFGFGGDDSLVGGDGRDTLGGGSGADTLEGGDGNDVASYTGSSAAVSIDLNDAGGGFQTASGGDAAGDVLSGIKRVWGSDFDDTLTGDAMNNLFYGRDGADTIAGGDGNDTIGGGSGGDADSLSGGDGIDLLTYVSSAGAVTIDLNDAGGGFQSAAGGDAAGDVISGFERVWGSDFGDMLTGDANNNLFYGRDGADTIAGGDGNDTIGGGGGGDADSLSGGDGTGDVLSYTGSAGAVTIDLNDAGGGLQSASGGDAAGDVISGFERVWGSDFGDTLTGDANNNVLFGRDGADTIVGGDGNDTIGGGGGGDADSLSGGDGRDVLSYISSSGGVTIDLNDAGGGFQSASGGDAAGDVISGFETVWGSSFADLLTGDGIDNLLSGRDGSDALYGGDGNDTLIGGNDGDAFAFDTALGAGNVDRIEDFDPSEGDYMLLETTIFTALSSSGNLLASEFRANTTGLAEASADRIVYNTNTGEVFYDADGLNGTAAVLFAVLTGAPSIDNNDFLVV
ncbi:beta strand repeat-containing protein [Lutimaribacter marinistellae]|uniref:Beta strand repeat-containing protein n=1 Tax=Lutimaribacter marinistellae TaxID=1820329 RepID=A0ABV7TJ69_9RHOB